MNKVVGKNSQFLTRVIILGISKQSVLLMYLKNIYIYWCFEHSGDISCSALVNPSNTDESWEGRNTFLWIYIYIYMYIYIYIYLYIDIDIGIDI